MFVPVGEIEGTKAKVRGHNRRVVRNFSWWPQQWRAHRDDGIHRGSSGGSMFIVVVVWESDLNPHRCFHLS